jgi:hypothetical protein
MAGGNIWCNQRNNDGAESVRQNNRRAALLTLRLRRRQPPAERASSPGAAVTASQRAPCIQWSSGHPPCAPWPAPGAAELDSPRCGPAIEIRSPGSDDAAQAGLPRRSDRRRRTDLREETHAQIAGGRQSGAHAQRSSGSPGLVGSRCGCKFECILQATGSESGGEMEHILY